MAQPMNSSTSPSRPAQALRLVLSSCLAGLLCLMVFNYQVDRWGIYQSGDMTFVDRGLPNVFYLKSRYLLHEAERKDCLVLGSSRVEVLDMRLFPPNCYNFNHPYGSPTKSLQILRDLVKADKAPRVVYIGLDDASYTIADRDSQGSRPAPDNALQLLLFHARYLLRNPQWVDLDILSGRVARIDMPWVVLDPQLGQDKLRELAAGYFADPAGQDQRLGQKRATLWGDDDAVEAALQVMAQFRELSRRAGIELRFFFNPMHYKTYLKIDHEKFNRFRQGLAPIMPFMDFSGLGKATLDNRYWKETSHYGSLLGDAVAACLTGQGPTLDLPCQLIDGDTIAAHQRSTYRADFEALLENDKFLGTHFIPPTLGELALSGELSISVEPVAGGTDIAYSGLKIFEGGYRYADGQDPQMLFSDACFAPDSAYILRVELEYQAPQLLHVYTPGAAGRYNADRPVRRDRLEVDAGPQQVYIFIRGLSCTNAVRLDPMQNRGSLFLHSSTLYQIGQRK
jgi:hypothetical protein